ncbi:TPA: hypothetical protein ACH3X1_015378 [Trebouxia sp. C0004]
MQPQEALAEVKSHLGKVVYKGDFLPLLRKYRQDQDTPRLTAGLREITAPLLPNHRLIHSLATLLPSALQQAFLHQHKTTIPKLPEEEQSGPACSVRRIKRQRLSQASEQPPAHVLTDSIHASDQDDTPLHMPKPLAAQPHALCDTHTARDPADDPICAQAAGHLAVTSQHEELTAPGQGLPTAKPVCDNKHLPDASHQKQPVGHHASAHAQADSPPGTANTQSISAAATQFRGNVKRVKDAESFQRQKERRQKKAAFLLDGTTTGPVVGVAKGGSWGHAAQQHAVRMQSSQIVHLPVQPNRSQVLLMQSITAALLQKRHALLESPTGTGKTLALLCATLAWQQQQALLAGQQPDAPTPRIFWAARTHAQIDHAVHEVRRTSYRPMMTILASRERFCLHPDIATAPNKTEACERATMVGHMDCSYLENAEASWYPQGPEHLAAYKPGGRLETFDIEELVAEGRAGHVCPYHASRDVLNEGAALVFVTYSQLLDPPVRSANGLDDLLQGAVLVFDEAHNIAAECRAAATLQMSTDDLQALALDLGGMQGSLNKMAPASRQWRQAADWARELAHLVDTMQTWLARQLSSTSLPFQKEQGMSNSRAAAEVWEGTGPDAYTAVVHHLNLSIHRVETLQGRLKAMRRGLIEGGFESTAVKSGAINQLEALLSKLLFVLQTRGLGYRCILTRHSTAGKARRGLPAVLPHTKGPDSQSKSQGVPIEGSFSFLCLHAAVALTPLIPKAHSLLLTSGTLSPVAPLVAELGLGTKPKRQVSNVPPKTEVADPIKGLGLAPEPQGHPTAAADSSSSKSHQADVSDVVKAESQHLIRHHSVHSGSLSGTHIQVAEQALTSEPSSVRQSAVQQGLQNPAPYSGTASQPGSLQRDAQQSHCCQSANQEAAPLQDAGDRSLESNSCTHQLLPLQSSACPQPQVDPLSELQSGTAQKAGIVLQPTPVRSQYASLHQGVELVSAPHHHTLPTRLLPLTISMVPGADGRLVKLDSAYERRQDAGYLDALGNAMLAICRAIPNGVLCFFPSWGLLNAARDQWLVTGLWQQLSACKEVIAEPTNVSGEVFDEAIKSYRQAAAKTQGAVLLAVMRGRSSEGVDFLDDCARAVVVVGIPYPPLYETSVRLKRMFNHDHEALLGSGDDWYAAEAFRAVNQAIGRLIRHQKDYGCVLLLDHRYNVLKFRQLTPAWLHPLLKSTAMADAPSLLQNFFAGRC